MRVGVGENIRRLAGMHLARQEDVGAYLGMTKAGVSNIVTGRSQPSVTTARKLAAGFGISLDALFSEDPKVPLGEALASFDEAPLARRRRDQARPTRP
jgi:transcriptional regulator with XRE-family HTH domain